MVYVALLWLMLVIAPKLACSVGLPPWIWGKVVHFCDISLQLRFDFFLDHKTAPLFQHLHGNNH